MPGMMDTILNLGLNDEVAEGMVEKTGNPHFVYDSYRRFVQMYGDVVLGMKPENKEDIDPFEAIIEKVKEEQGVVLDKDLSVESLKKLVELFKKAIKEQTGSDFPTDPKEQLWGAICAVFRSWMNERAILYRKMEGIPDEWGTAVSVMAMVFGNMGETSATGVCFSRDAGNGENLFNGEYLIIGGVGFALIPFLHDQYLQFIPFLIIKIQSPGPIFFRQARTGLNGDTFMCLKFRSMHVNRD